MELSEHFTLLEFTKSQTALRRGIVNRPDPTAIKNMQRVAREILEPVRSHFSRPFSPSSGYRCAALNAAVGSKSHSQHLTGEAVDFEVPGIANPELANWIAETLIFDQLILEFYDPYFGPGSGWVHCSFKATDNRGRILTLNRNRIMSGIQEKL